MGASRTGVGLALAIMLCGAPARADDDDDDDDEYPLGFIARPFVLPDDMLQATAQVAYLHADAGGSSVTATSLVALMSYGVTDELQLDLGTALLVAPEPGWSETATAGAHYLVVNEETFAVAPGLVAAFSFAEDASVLSSVALDALTWQTIFEHFFLYGGNGLVTATEAAGDWNVAVNLAGGPGVQLAEPFALWFQTRFLHASLTGDTDATTYILDDGVVPLDVFLLYATDHMLDVTGQLSFTDVSEASSLLLQVGVSLRM